MIGRWILCRFSILSIKKSEIEEHVAALEGASNDTCHAFQNWLDRHRFYLNEKQCDRINMALKRLDDPMRINI